MPIQAYTANALQDAIRVLQSDWTPIEDRVLQLHVSCRTFDEAISFVNHVAKIANAVDHHPDMYIHYKEVTIELSTHDADGITDKDISLAKQIESIL